MLDVRKIRLTLELRNAGISDSSVLSAIEKIPREVFIPSNFRNQAYENIALPIGDDQTISQPYIVAFMTEQLQISSEHKVLEIGTGSGYQAAILGELAKHVYTIEIIPELAEGAKNILKRLGYNNITVQAGDGYKGWPDEGPFERIMVTAAPTDVPQTLVDQLAPGGRMILPVGAQFLVQYLWVIEKDYQEIVTKKKILPVRFVPMVKE